ncbi:MAG TPA: RDD family protein [Thermoanaerobaculia bacterium]
MPRFDQIELEPVVVDPGEPLPTSSFEHAPRFRRFLSLVTDLSLFVALSLALSPLLPVSMNWQATAALAGFIVIVSFYYFAGMWLLWGKTIGGMIFDVKVIASGNDSMAFRQASLRWFGVYVSLLTGGIGFLLAALPSRLSLADRLSRTRCVSAV